MFLSRRICVLFIAVIFLGLISGCASLPITGPLPEGVSVKKLQHFDGNSPLAWHPGGDKFAFVDGDLLQVYDLKTGNAMPFVPGTELSALDWSPDGHKLAAAFRQGDDSLLRIFDTSGHVLAESKIHGDATKLMWRSIDEVLVSAIATKKFSFGVNFSGVLYRWKGTAAPTAKVLNDTTIKAVTARMPKEALKNAFTFALSPLGDEVIYTKLVDPPMFPAFLKIAICNLESGADHEVPAEAALTSGGAVFACDGESIVYGDGFSTTVQLDPWTGAKKRVLPSPGRTITLSPANLYLFLDGTLFRQEQAMASFPAMARGAFSPRGDHLLLSFEKSIYLVSGLGEPPAATLPPTVKERLLVLRKWRSDGLISPAEYETAKGKLQQ